MATVISGDAGVSQVQDGIITPPKLTQKLTAGTAQATTSGTFKDFTSIPSWVKRITLQLVGVSTSGTDGPAVRLGSGGIVSSGYSISISQFTDAAAVVVIQNAAATELPLWATAWDTTFAAHSQIVLTNVSGNTWAASGLIGCLGSARSAYVAGSVTLSGALDTVRLTTPAGTGTFDAGSINILYEG